MEEHALSNKETRMTKMPNKDMRNRRKQGPNNNPIKRRTDGGGNRRRGSIILLKLEIVKILIKF